MMKLRVLSRKLLDPQFFQVRGINEAYSET